MSGLIAYKMRDLQHALQVLVQMDKDGVADVKAAIAMLGKHVYRSQTVAAVGGASRLASCPGCSTGRLIGPYRLDGVKIIRCSKKCGYSEVIG